MPESSMFAIRKLEAKPGLTWVDDAPVPELGPDDVLIAVAYAGLCGTDRHIYEWDQWGAEHVTPPTTIGHEFTGSVTAVGSNVTGTTVGQRVSGEGHIGCGECDLCHNGNAHVCTEVKVVGIDRDGAFAKYVAIPEKNTWKLSDHIPDRVGGVMDPLGNAVHTVMSADVAGKSVLITGVGVIGLMAVAVAKYAGAKVIVVSDVSQHHLDKAKELGADFALRADEEGWWEAAKTHTYRGDGFDCWLEMSGAPHALTDGFRALRNGGTAALLGLPSKPVTLDLGDGVIFKGATVKGIYGRKVWETWEQMDAFLADNASVIESLITHEIPARQFDEAFALLTDGNAIKVLLNIKDA